MTGTVILDNEAVQALWSPEHRKHRKALSYVQVLAVRKRKGRRGARVVVPVAVRVEAGWDRSNPEAAFINLVGIGDAPLDKESGNRAAAIATEHQVSVADAHVGATAQLLPDSADPVTIIFERPGRHAGRGRAKADHRRHTLTSAGARRMIIDFSPSISIFR